MKYLIAMIYILMTLSVSAKDTRAQSEMLGLGTTVYMVTDIDKAKQWYSKAFGVGPYFDEPYYVGFNIRGYELGLMPAETTINQSGVISYWRVHDVKATYARLIAFGATELEPIADVGGGILLGVVADPFGNPLGLIYNPSFQVE